MKTFTTSGTGNQQTLSPIETDKIPVYDSVTDAVADLANLAENQIIATHDTGSELSAPVDTVQSGNMHAVTSNAVAGALSLGAITPITIPANTSDYFIDKSGYLIITGTSTGNSVCTLYVNSVEVCKTTVHNDYSNVPFSFLFPVKKGDRIYLDFNTSYVNMTGTYIREYSFM